MEKDNRYELREWINTGAAIIAIGFSIAGFIKIFSDNEDFAAQLKQTTNLAIATNKLAFTSDSTLKESRRQNDLIEGQNIILKENKSNAEIRYILENKPYFSIDNDFDITDSIKYFANNSYSLINKGNQAKIVGIKIGKLNTYRITEQTRGFVEKGEYFSVFLESDFKVNVLDFWIIMEDKIGNKYMQRIHSNKGGKIFAEIPIVNN